MYWQESWTHGDCLKLYHKGAPIMLSISVGCFMMYQPFLGHLTANKISNNSV